MPIQTHRNGGPAGRPDDPHGVSWVDDVPVTVRKRGTKLGERPVNYRVARSTFRKIGEAPDFIDSTGSE